MDLLQEELPGLHLFLLAEPELPIRTDPVHTGISLWKQRVTDLSSLWLRHVHLGRRGRQ